MESTEPTSNDFPGSRLLPSRWADLGAKAFGWLFEDGRSNGDSAHPEPEEERRRAGTAGTAGATESESARKLRFWFSERNRHTL